MFEELRTYLDLVDELGDPFTIFERGWPEEEAEPESRHALREDPPAVPDVGFPG